MARRGRFGRLPRRAPDLTASLVSIAREMQNLRDQNIVDAWEKGGEFEGQQVTDEMILQHWKNRRDSLDSNDPLWDQYNNLVENYTFSIEDSKMTLGYAEGKISDSKMAAFYREWANKVPTDSEVYRKLMRSAAQYADWANQKSKAAAASRKQTAYNADWLANYEKNVKPYVEATNVLIAAAVQDGILTTEEADRVYIRLGGSKDGAELTEMLTSAGPQWDQNKLLILFDKIDDDPAYAVYKDAISKLGINNFTYDVYVGLGENRLRGINNGAEIAKRYDDQKTADEMTQTGLTWLRELNFLKDVDVVADYNSARAAYERAVRNEDNPYVLDRLAREYAKTLRDLGQKATDPATRGAINREADANEGMLGASTGRPDSPSSTGLTIAETATGRGATNVTGTNRSDLDETISSRAQLDSVLDGLAKGTMVRVPADVASALGIAVPNGVAYTYAPTQAVAGLENNYKGAVVFDTRAGRSVPVFVPFTEIHARAVSAFDPRTGRASGEAKPTGGADTLIGYQMTMPDGTVRYGVYDLDGGRAEDGRPRLWWTSEQPWATGYATSSGPNGTIVVSPTTPVTGTYNPADAINPRYGRANPDSPTGVLMNSDRWPDVYSAANYATSSQRKSLINANETDVRAYYTGLYGNSQTMVADPSDPSKAVPVATVDLIMNDFHQSRVNAAAYDRDPQLLQKSAAATAGVKFWGDYLNTSKPSAVDQLIAESPAAVEAKRRLDLARLQQNNIARYGDATPDAFGGIEVITPEQARQKAIDTLRESITGTAPQGGIAPLSTIADSRARLNELQTAPTIKLPSLLSSITGQKPNWIVDYSGREYGTPDYRDSRPPAATYGNLMPKPAPVGPPAPTSPGPRPIAPPPTQFGWDPNRLEIKTPSGPPTPEPGFPPRFKGGTPASPQQRRSL